jgi:hypothetical protein
VAALEEAGDIMVDLLSQQTPQGMVLAEAVKATHKTQDIVEVMATKD